MLQLQRTKEQNENQTLKKFITGNEKETNNNLVAGVLLLLFSASTTKADGLASDLQGMQPVLDNVYSQMLPLLQPAHRPRVA